MGNITYISTEGIEFDEVDTMNCIRWKVADLKQEGYSNEDIEEFILSDDSLEGDVNRLIRFLEKTLEEYKQ